MGEHGRPGPVTASTVTAPWLVSARTDLYLVFVLGAVWSGAAVASVVLGSGFLLVAALFRGRLREPDRVGEPPAQH